MKNYLLRTGLLTILFAVLFFAPDLLAQVDDAPTFIDQIKTFLNQYFLTEAAFLAMTFSVTQFILKLFPVDENKFKLLISFGVTLVAGILGLLLQIGIFADMGAFDVIVFVIMKTFAGNGFFDWLKNFNIIKKKEQE